MAAAASVTPAAPQVGKPVVVNGTGFALSHACTIVDKMNGYTINVTSDGSGNLSSSPAAVIVPQTDAPLDFRVSDGTSSVDLHVEVTTE